MTAAASAAGELRELYRELILDHARSPRHYGELEGATHTAEGINPLCGDKLKVYLRVDEAGRIDGAAFEGSGCAISIASASLLTDIIHGLSTRQAKERSATVVSSLAGEAGQPRDQDLGKLAALQGVKEFPARVKCATLAWRALDAAIDHGKTATTE